MDQVIEKQKTVTIGDDTYTIVLLAPSKAIKNSLKLTKMIAEPMASMAGIQKFGLESVLPMAAKAIAARLDEAEVMAIVHETLGTVLWNNKPVHMDRDFHGRLGALVRLIGKALEVQYGDFFDGLADVVKEAMGSEEEASA